MIPEAAGHGHDSNDENGGVAAIPLLVRNAVPGLSDQADEDAKLEHDVDLRPDAPSLEGMESLLSIENVV